MKNFPAYERINKQAAVKSLMLGLALWLIIIFAIPPLLINPILNGLKNGAVKQVKTGTLSAGRISYSLLYNEILIERVSYSGAESPIGSVNADIYSAGLKDANLLKYFLGLGISVGCVTLRAPFIEFGAGVKKRNMPENKGVSASSILFNGSKETPSSMPEALENVYIGKLEIKSGRLNYFAEGRKDSIGGYDLTADDINIREGELSGLLRLSFAARDLCKTFSKGYKLTAEFARYTGGAKLFEAENVKYFSDWSDKDYFASLTLREDKLAFEAEKISAELGEAEIGEKPRLAVENIKLQKPHILIITPKYIPLPENPPKEVMPNEALQGLPFGIKIDNLYVEGGSILLHELYKPGGKHAELTFGNIELEARDITGRYFNQKAPARLKAKAYLQEKGEMLLELTMPLQEKDFSYSAKGSLKQMDLRELNGYLERSEFMQITSGIAESVEYEINASNGLAEVMAAPVYHDIKIKSLDEATGKESGLDEKTASFIANNFILRKSNPDKKGGLKTARAARAFKPDETFFERLWLPLKKGLGDVVGFKE